MEAVKNDNQAQNPIIPSSAGALSQVVKDKKKKKKKLTAKERAIEKLEKSCEKLIEDSEQFNNLMVSVSYWLKNKEKILYKLFHRQALLSLDHEMFLNTIKPKEEKENNTETNHEINTLSTIDFKLSYDDFKLVTTDLDIPCTNVQLHTICKLLDEQSTSSIDFRKFTPDFLNSHIRRHQLDGIRFIKKSELTPTAITFKKELAKNFAGQQPMYIKLDLKLVTFATDKEYKSHIKDEIVNTKSTIRSLIELIKDKLDIVSRKISIFQDATKIKSSYMEENRTLEFYGFTGGAYNDIYQSSEKITLYFDYWILANDDPILNCDFYFHDYKYKK